MKQATMIIAAIALVALSIPGCLEDILEDTEIQIVLMGESYADFPELETGADNPEIAIVDVADEIDDILDDNGYSRSDIDEAFVTSASYDVTWIPPSQTHDWVLSGAISVRRLDPVPGPLVPIVNYSQQSVQAALGEKIPAQLEPLGVDVVNQALDDYLAGQDPRLEFQVLSSTIVPVPSPTDPMVFDWRVWIAIQLIATQTVEVPDPF